MRGDGRRADELRPLRSKSISRTSRSARSSAEMGRTRVLCTVCEEPDVPRRMRGQRRAAGSRRSIRCCRGATEHAQRARGEPRASSPAARMEIQRLIGRSLRAVVDLKALGERTLYVDCDVLQADGGTRTRFDQRAPTSRWRWRRAPRAPRRARRRACCATQLAAVSVGVVDGVALLDLPYAEDSRAEVDMNVVGMGSGR